MYNWCVQLYGGVGVPFVEPFVATNSSIAVLAGGYLQRLGTSQVRADETLPKDLVQMPILFCVLDLFFQIYWHLTNNKLLIRITKKA